MDIKDLSRTQLETIIDEWIVGDLHSKRNRDVIKDRLINGYIYDYIADKYDMSVPQIRTIISKGKRIILKHLG